MESLNKVVEKICMILAILVLAMEICTVPMSAQNSKTYLIPVPKDVQNLENSVKMQEMQTKIIQNAQQQVDLLKENLIDITGVEEAIIEDKNKDRTTWKTISIISDYRIFPEKAKKTASDVRIATQDSLRQSVYFREERQMVSAKENGRVIKSVGNPFWDMTGGSFVDFFFCFDKQNENIFDYKLLGFTDVNKRNAYVMEVKAKERVAVKMPNAAYIMDYSALVLVDAVTLEFFQIAGGIFEQMFGVEYYFFSQYEYEKVKIKSQLLLLPVSKTINVYYIGTPRDAKKYPYESLPKGFDALPLGRVYKYKYSDYKAFNVDMKIRFGTMEEELLINGMPEPAVPDIVVE